MIFSVILFTITRIKASIPITERLLRGLKIYTTPSEVELNASGQGSVGLPYTEIDDKFSRISPYFTEADFTILVALATGLTWIIAFTMKGNQYVLIEHNLTFFMIILVISTCIAGMY